MKRILLMVLASLTLCIHTQLEAQPLQGIDFTSKDWEIYCSNTGTCQAAGYQNDNESGLPVSILLTRKAGPKQLVQGEFALSNEFDELSAEQLKHIHFYLNDKDWGEVRIDDNEFPLLGKLSLAQTNALLKYSQQNVSIVFKNKQHFWQVSDAGMAAVLLKMDDFQKRVGTQSALVKKGQLTENNVLKPQPKLRIKKVNTSAQPYLVLQPHSKAYLALRQLLRAATPITQDQDECEALEYAVNNADMPAQPIELYKLSHQKVLAVTACWRAAYNEGYGAWVLSQSLKGPITYVTNMANDIDSGEILSSYKGRGIGDCWGAQTWIWTGQRYVQSQDMWTGMCRGLAAGGVWQLNRIEADVQ